MRLFFLNLCLCLCLRLSGQPQVTISLITDQGVMHSDNLNFYISNGGSQSHNFTFTQFSKTGQYPNRNLTQYSEKIKQGDYQIHVSLIGNSNYTLSDSLNIISKIKRVEIFIFIGVKDSMNDFIKEVRTLLYYNTTDPLSFTPKEALKIGSKAAFIVTNSSENTFYGYPNNSFFFGTLYKNSEYGSWSQYYPLYIVQTYCDTIADPKPLPKNGVVEAFTPNKQDCSEFEFKEHGSYYFELLFSDTKGPEIKIQNDTKLTKQFIYRQIFKFSF